MNLPVLKFGGTSVGSPQRLKDLVKLTADGRPKVVVLSAMSGTTNTLVEICSALYRKDAAAAKDLIEGLRKKYAEVVSQLYSEKKSSDKASQMCANHFSFISSFTLDMFTVNEEKAILAQGELLSTALYHYYLEEQGYGSVLLPA